ncbi:uncharacterized protein LOC110931348 [Helianthus annuus]|uniref:uncharacterized protein LOC110931348 n=1 Tax=Helianthus annuus TaxID=4232 RepID=UPI000B8F4AD7|nr:uncharacterized protein LOC110931348 [Helianthus annuus]
MNDRDFPGSNIPEKLVSKGLFDQNGVPLSPFAADMRETGSSPDTVPVRGIGLRVTNIEGLSTLPRRGMFYSDNVSVIDGLAAISKPVIMENAVKDGSGSVGEGECHIHETSSQQEHVTAAKSYAQSVRGTSERKVNFRSLEAEEKQDGCDVVLSRDSVRVVQDKLANTLYGYFLGDRVAFPVVDYFVKNNWKRFGLQKSMMNANGYFFFKFADHAGMMNALNEGPWIIRSQPLFLELWSPSVKLEKKEVKKVQVWVKFHEVPIAAYTEDGLSLIATTIGEPKALDSFTTSMCVDMWGRSSFARALVEISADSEFKEELTIAVPRLDGDGFIKEKVYVEYEWCPHRCERCRVFGHTNECCPKQASKGFNGNNQHGKSTGKQPIQERGIPKRQPMVDDDGYTTVQGKKVAKKVGFNVNKPKQKFEYRPVASKGKKDEPAIASKGGSTSSNPGGSRKKAEPAVASVQVSNSFDALNDPDVNMDENGDTSGPSLHEVEDEEVVEVLNASYGDEMDDFLRKGTAKSDGTKGASTPSSSVNHANYYVTRRDLWHNLAMHKLFVRNEPWVILGDFNSALNLEDKSMGCSSVSASMKEFQACVDDIEMVDLNRTGIHFTWNQKPKKGIGLMKKIDRVMGNTQFIATFPSAVAMFYPSRLSDHCPCVLKVPEINKPKHRPFKFANFLVHKPEFMGIVKQAWDTSVSGVHQFSVVKKLRLLKPPLRGLLFQQGNLHKKVQLLRDKLDGIQRDLDTDLNSVNLRVEESNARRAYQEALLDEERFLKQKSKVDWLSAGDMNSAFFHSALKNKIHYSRIDVIQDTSGNEFENDLVHKAFVEHYEKFLGCKGTTSLSPSPDLFTKTLEMGVATHMVRPVTPDEVRQAIFSIGSDKAPGPDGFTAGFFKSAWPIVGNEVSNAVMDFFVTGRLLRELNHTLIVLIPKITSPSVVTDYRPIACCNVLYKCISKIIAERIKVALNDIVSINQSAFVPGRKISDNILLTQELMHNYHRNIGPPKCSFKVDIQKAYDTVDWDFLKNILIGFGFHADMVHWIMVCVSTTTFSVCINGDVHGFFKGNRGLRQGDPISPYLFTLVMEILTAILQHAVRIDSSFKFHNKCERQQIINLCFADDLFIFSRGEIASARCIMKSLDSFAKMSGLLPNIQKSTIYFSNVPSYIKTAILNIMPFREGSLPVRYLGVPLISSRLLYKDCQVMVEKLEKRIMHWRNKLLSFAGRVQLIVSVLSSMYIFWSSVFILPNRVILELEALMRNFLWSQDSAFQKGRAKVSWKAICVPKFEGGLGIRRIRDVNKALMTAHIWSIISRRDSLWVQWVHSYRLKGKSFWACRVPASCDGLSTSAWFDNWSLLGPLEQFISPRSIANAGFNMESKVSDVFANNSWRWPSAWRDLYPVLIQLDQLSFDTHRPDKLVWRHGDQFHDFSTSRAWDSIRHRELEVGWSRIVWFGQCIPRHAFLMWLIMRRKLLTQDKILSWDFSRRKNMDMMCCLLCYANHDSHSHLFFECKYSAQVWHTVRCKVGMASVQAKWDDIVNWLLIRSKSKSAADYISRLGVAASAYFIWQERNARLFKNQLRPPEILSELIIQQVRYKLMGARLKNCDNVRRLLREWEIEGTELHDDGG